jgi:hypothetical protein
MYNTDNATGALFRYYLDRGFDERNINQPSRLGYDEDDGYTFVHRDAEGALDLKVEFIDDEGGETVTFANGESGDVRIGDDDD